MTAATRGGGLRERMLRSAAWLLGSTVSSQALRLLSNLVLTRLLAPDAFGLVAAVNTLYFALVMFSDLGVWQSVVKSERGLDSRFLGTAWAVQCLRGVGLAVVVLALALVLGWGAQHGWFAAATVYADPRLAPLVAVFAVCALLQGLESMSLATAQRELRVAALARLELGGQVLATGVTIALAWFTGSVWSLALGTLLASALRTGLSHVLLPVPHHRLCWDRQCLGEIVGFGKWIVVSSIIGFLAAHGEKLILAATLGTASFGVFAIANTLIVALIGVYGSLNGHVLFAGLSASLRESGEQSRALYLRVQQWADLVLGLMAGTLFMAGHWIVEWLYDARYHEAGWMLRWLGLYLLAIRHQVVEQLMFARGVPAWVTAANALRALGLVLLVPLGYRWGAEAGAIAAVVAAQFCGWPVALVFKARQGLLTWSSERVWLPALLAGLGLGALANALLRSLGQ